MSDASGARIRGCTGAVVGRRARARADSGSRRFCTRQGIDVVAETHSGRELAERRRVGAARPRRRRPARRPLASTTSCAACSQVRPRPAIVALVPSGSGRRRRHAASRSARRGIALRSGTRRRAGRRVRVGAEGRALRRARRCTGRWPGTVKPPPLDDRIDELLSAREREVLACLAEGRSNREIAATSR